MFVLQKVKGHENIVQMHDVFESRSKFCIILDYLGGGQLFDRIIDAGFFNEKFASNLFYQMCKALSYIHELGIIHRDIKPQNLIFETKADDSRLKLIDFGFAVSFDPKIVKNKKDKKNKDNDDNDDEDDENEVKTDADTGKLREVCGTPNYMAPEILEEKPYDAGVDMWAAGCILHTMYVFVFFVFVVVKYIYHYIR